MRLFVMKTTYMCTLDSETYKTVNNVKKDNKFGKKDFLF